MRIVFMGTPEFAVPSLKALVDNGYNVVGVISQPDRPAGRGNKLEAGPVKKFALEHDIPVYQFEKLRRQEGRTCLESLQPDICVTAAFGQILSQKLLDIPTIGTVNVHASLLPKHRGSAPINWCLYQGDETTGITIMMTDIGMDTGDIILKKETEILPNENAGELTVRLSEMGAELLIEALKKIEDGTYTRTKQDEALSSYEPMLEREMARIDWSLPAKQVNDRIRAFNPWPGAFTDALGGTMKVWKAEPVEYETASAHPGEVIVSSAKLGLIVVCAAGTALNITEMQAPAAKRMTARAYLAGKQIPVGTILGGSNDN